MARRKSPSNSALMWSTEAGSLVHTIIEARLKKVSGCFWYSAIVGAKNTIAENPVTASGMVKRLRNRGLASQPAVTASPIHIGTRYAAL